MVEDACEIFVASVIDLRLICKYCWRFDVVCYDFMRLNLSFGTSPMFDDFGDGAPHRHSQYVKTCEKHILFCCASFCTLKVRQPDLVTVSFVVVPIR